LSFETERKAELCHSHLSRSEVLEEEIMDKDGVEGVLGDAKLESDGRADRAAGKIQNAFGGVKDTLKGK
jgi:hypothetical protein